jgi:ribosome-binding factor A
MGELSFRRAARVGTLLREELSGIIRDELRDPRVGFVSITSVEVTDDLRHARAFVTVLGEEDERRASVDALNRAGQFIRTILGRRVRLRRVPEIEFRYDSSIDRGMRISRLLDELRNEEGKD